MKYLPDGIQTMGHFCRKATTGLMSQDQKNEIKESLKPFNSHKSHVLFSQV